MIFFLACCFISSVPVTESFAQPAGVEITGELKKWHPITLTFDGPQAEEEGATNPFLDVRLDVTFTRGNTSITVPGYFAADGNAGESGATGGNKWRVHFVPDATGDWNYSVSLREGDDVAISSDPAAGAPAAGDGLAGSFSVSDTDKSGRDFRSKGMLRYVDEHYLRFDNGEYFIKGGADSPENFLGYFEFDNTEDNGCKSNDLTDGIHRYQPHVNDWNPGDPVWHGSKGKGIIGALNYLASKGINSVYFLTMNTKGDGCEVYPWTEYGANASERLHYDVSKLDQWNVVFDHMDRLGIMLHVVTQETENDQLLDGGDLGTERRLYYRELIARFGYHLAITWNLGEENTNTPGQREDFVNYMSDLEPYGQNFVIHTYKPQLHQVYEPLLGYPNGTPVKAMTGASIQTDLNNLHGKILTWLERSREMGHPWVVALDEIGPAGTGASPDGPGNNHARIRDEALWATLMAGGAGVEWYFGYSLPHNDMDLEDWRTRDQLWEYTTAAVNFFQTYLPFTEMTSADDLIAGTDDYVFAKPGEVYAVYLNDASNPNPITLPQGAYSVMWYNPRDGASLTGTIETVNGPGEVDFGSPPSDTGQDWALLLKNTGQGTSYRPPDQPANTAAGLQYAYYEGEWDDLPDFDMLSPVATGFTPNVDLSLSQRDDQFAFLFDGFVNAPEDGIYTFYIESDDGSRLLIGNQSVVDNDGTHAVTEKQGAIALAKGLHAFTLVYFEKDGGEALSASWSGPGLSKQSIDDGAFVYDADNLLPVELVDFGGVLDGDRVVLAWETASELNNAGFEVQRAIDEDAAFATIAFVDGSGTSTAAARYEFVDATLPAGAQSVSYRLKQIDFDGTAAYSDVVELALDLPVAIRLAPNYPNPFNPSTTIAFTLPVQQHVRLSIFDSAGRLVEVLLDGSVPAGSHTVPFEAAPATASGMYIYRLETAHEVISGSMMLLK